MNTRRYKELKSRIAELRKNLLPSKFSPTGDYKNGTIDKAKGYQLLVHAELEAYFEDMARDISSKAIDKWNKEQKATKQFVSLLVAYHSLWEEADLDSLHRYSKQLKGPHKPIDDKIKEVVKKTQDQYSTILKGNNGIKEENLKKIVRPLGIEITESDWLLHISNFGSSRGDTAHLSTKATHTINPKDELDRVENIMEGIKKIDSDFFDVLEMIDKP